ncbi:MAG: trigger factor [Clostridia bacterium]|nr:trigger factor [Clostridia bacterium]
MLNYKGLHATREHLTVTDAQVDEQIDRLLAQSKKTVQITDRPAQADDEIILDYAGECDGEFFEGGTAQRQALTLGSGMFIPGFEEQLIGCTIGEKRDVRVTFPTEYHAKNLAGKPAVFHCTVHEIHLKEKYAADDTFAREVGGCETFEQFRQSMRDSMQAYVDRQADEEMRDQLMNQICATLDYQITDDQLKRAVDQAMQTFSAQLARQNLTIEMYCKFIGATEASLREDAVPEARKNILRAVAIDRIAEAEGIEADEDSMADMMSAIMQQNHLTKEQLQSYVTDDFMAAVARGVVSNKVLDLIVENAVIEDVEK